MTTQQHVRQFFSQSDLGQALEACKSSFFYAGFFSLFINLLLLVPSFYMLAVYDKVLVSGSESTLLMLSLLAVFLFLVMGGLEWIRSQILIASSARLDGLLGGRVFDSMFTQMLASGGRSSSAQALQDLLQLRQFLTGPGLFAFFDAPWMPIYLVLMFLFHWAFGVVAVISGLILAALAIWNEIATKQDLNKANQASQEANQFTQRNLRNAEVIEAMGMLPRLRERWQQQQSEVIALQGKASSKAGLISGLVKTFRLAIQSLVLGLGAYLAIHKEITPGLVIAGSILLGRALAPLDLMVNTWRGFSQAREAFHRLTTLLETFPKVEPAMPLPEPQGHLTVEQLIIAPPGCNQPIIKGISLTIDPGQTVAIIGPSAAGKSTFVRALLGLYRPAKGAVRLDGAEIQQWNREQLGDYLGYLPQDVELLDGTVSENIARFREVDPDQVVAAAQQAGIHDMILRLPQAYDTRLVGGGQLMSAGQQQRIGIARALYGNPKVVVLDEPNANLDQAGDAALMDTLAQLKRQGKTVVVVTHRNNLLSLADKILLLVDGQAAAFGPRDEVLAALSQPRTMPQTATA
ncbi:type I secretion system permease/ATPase [Methylomonas rivi]|uniref:Type I secretion system permease/ATPase n=1 Tax=Methylomonas rivi TaxID=2952226 RepID=A0ABT1U872_9GAMM|nr:type I secretion system permease/ATPase [Methylomonas sp. WSC-6]MCQ8129987.1 type I secretion system permease/ATPase [Methylomonas sp. WSC-6]